MNTRLNSLFIFVAGAAIGSVVTYKVVKEEYDRRIDILHELYNSGPEVEVTPSYDGEEEPEEIIESNALDEMRTAYSNIAHDAGYTEGYLDEREDDGMPTPYIIAPDEVGDLDYTCESLNYYADGTLTDQYDNIIDDVEGIIGDIKPEAHFGQYEQDTVYVRNDVTQCDYEILRDIRNYSDVYPEE